MPHRNARLTPHGRRLLIDRVTAGRPVAHVATELGISRATGHKWVRRYRQHGDEGLLDRSCRPHHSPRRVPDHTEQQIIDLRRTRRLGPARIAGILHLHASTVHRVLTRHHMP
ncbi:leucine zipper domain-containing protein, partial [Amycolatopsis sp. SID8362]|uniref:leucine zipper domain-containing protein n=1 Tax=Amycolatopsis sp. SID8362 TaxID=2690346 RepID=UPI0013721CBF